MKTLVLLEEDREAREVFAGVLRRLGYAVIAAGDEAEAHEAIISSKAVHLVIAGTTDHDRLSFVADVRDSRPHLPVVLMADYCEPESRLRGFLFGPFAALSRRNVYINVRPVALYELAELLRSVLVGRRANRKLRLAAA